MQDKKARIARVVVGEDEYFDANEDGLYDAELDEELCDLVPSWNIHPDVDMFNEGPGPPLLPDAEVEALDYEASLLEVSCLEEMGVLKRVLKPRLVYDWRFRNNQWIRRGRLVAKELKIWSPWRQDLFSPAATPAVVKLVPHVFTAKGGEWCLYSLDIKDAFLTVQQRDECYIVHEGAVFQVCKCLPGQRAAAQWWCEQISDDITAFGLQKSKVCPVLFGGEQMCMAVHIDDTIVCGRPAAVDKFISMLESKYIVQVTGPISKPGESLRSEEEAGGDRRWFAIH